ncbi:MAG: hypothetical protein HOC71_08780 [Candidatus Latescibacteria bacterium]|jgi:pentatricopeptide repeat protein|nr:hypothetical protein [Candidatus Latescibacterota bacterium]
MNNKHDKIIFDDEIYSLSEIEEFLINLKEEDNFKEKSQKYFRLLHLLLENGYNNELQYIKAKYTKYFIKSQKKLVSISLCRKKYNFKDLSNEIEKSIKLSNACHKKIEPIFEELLNQGHFSEARELYEKYLNNKSLVSPRIFRIMLDVYAYLNEYKNSIRCIEQLICLNKYDKIDAELIVAAYLDKTIENPCWESASKSAKKYSQVIPSYQLLLYKYLENDEFQKALSLCYSMVKEGVAMSDFYPYSPY